VTALAQICDPEVFGDLDPLNRTNCERCSQDLFELIGPMTNVFSQCMYIGISDFCEDLFRKVITEEGVCYTFNGLDVYRQDDESKSEWTLENGYANKTYRMDTYPRKFTKISAGPIQGFKLLLHIKNFSWTTTT
jgi:Amiloride-sensitive sodium channel